MNRVPFTERRLWVFEMIQLQTPPPATKTRSYVHLMRLAHTVCEEPELSRLFPRTRSAERGAKAADPLALILENSLTCQDV